MNKRIILINSEITDCIRQYFQNTNIDVLESGDICDLFVYNDYDGEIPSNAINIHPSLLPAFEGKNAIERAFRAGVKVSGVTISNNNRIIAQYPVLIGVNTHFDEFKNDIIDTEKRLVPPVIAAILEDRVFDFQDLFRNPCAHRGGCSGCSSKCH